MLLDKLKEERAFWSYAPEAVSPETTNDSQLITMTLRYLDIDEINILFSLYPERVIRKAWIENLVPEGEYLFTLNRFLAWYYFKAKRPDSYIKGLITRHNNKLFA